MNTNAKNFLEKSIGRLSFGKSLRAIRLGEEERQTNFAKKIGVSVQYLCDVEHGRKVVSVKKALAFAHVLGYPPEQFVALVLQDSLNYYDIPMHVEVFAA